MTDAREENIKRCADSIRAMLEEKVANYGERGGFFDANTVGHYDHALGGAKLKIGEYARTGSLRHLVKAITWLYLIYETEMEEAEKQLNFRLPTMDRFAPMPTWTCKPSEHGLAEVFCNYYNEVEIRCHLLIGHSGDHE